MGRDFGFLKILSHCFDCVGSQPFAVISQPELRRLLCTVEVIFTKTPVSHMYHVKIGDMALLLYEQPSN